MLDTVIGADSIEGVGAGRVALAGGAEAVGKLLAVVGEELVDGKGSLIDQALEEAAGGGCRLILEDFHVNPAGCAINGGEQIRALVRVRHLRQVFDVHMHEAWLIRLEPLHRRLGAFLLGQQGLGLATPWRRRQRSRAEREASGWMNSRVTTSRSSSGSSNVLRNSTTTTSWAGVRVVCKRGEACESHRQPCHGAFSGEWYPH